MDDAADEVHEQHQETASNDVVPDVEGFPGEPHDTSVLTDYAHYVAVTVWNEYVFIFLNK